MTRSSVLNPPPHHINNPNNADHDDWANFFRLLAISGLATFASIGNIFTISSVIVEDGLRRKGNSFLVSLTLSDLLLTSILLPSISVSILAQMEEDHNPALCAFQYSLVTMATVTSSLFTTVVAVENFLRLRNLRKEKRSVCSRKQAMFFNGFFWAVAGSVVFLLHYNEVNNVCSKGNTTPLPTIITTMSLLSFAGLFFLFSLFLIKRYPQPLTYSITREMALIKSNIYNYTARMTIYAIGLIVMATEETTAALFYTSIIPPCLTPLLFSLTNRDLLRCYLQLFNYCCCKTNVALTRRSRDRGGDVTRVHIIPGYNIYANSESAVVHHSNPLSRFSAFNKGYGGGHGSSGGNSREVYEL